MKNGIILIDKPKGKTSRDMVNELNHIFDMKKIGHTGTLDPIATGLLIMCLGKYTKLVSHLQCTQKEYIATVKVGISTDTLDITGNVIEERKCQITKEDVINALEGLRGNLLQEIPIYSAKKVNGKKLYEYARENIEVERPKNLIEVFSLELLDIKDDEFTFKALVGKGTYIRSLIQVICNKMGVIGTMKDLRRTKEWNFDVDKDAYTTQDIKNNNYKILKASDFFSYPKYNLNDEEYNRVKNGNKIFINEESQNIILLYEDKEIAIYIKENDYFKAEIMLI